MGAENAVFEHDGEMHIGLTYMTGTLVKFGQRAAAAFMGGPDLRGVPMACYGPGSSLARLREQRRTLGFDSPVFGSRRPWPLLLR
ncbi:MAG: hypothetical protein ABI668_12645 [Sphingorhabdus sp.]